MSVSRVYIFIFFLFCLSKEMEGRVVGSELEKAPPKGSLYMKVKRQGDALYRLGSYRHALLHYSSLNKRYGNEELKGLISDCYWEIGMYDSSLLYMSSMMSPGIKHRERIAEIEARKGRYELAIKGYKSLEEIVRKNADGTMDVSRLNDYGLRVAGFSSVDDFYKDSSNWLLQYLSINSEAEETQPYVYRGELYVVSNRWRNKGFAVDKTYKPSYFQYAQSAGSIEDLTTRSIYHVNQHWYRYDLSHLQDLTVSTSNDSKSFLPDLRPRPLMFHGGNLVRLFEFGYMREAVGNIQYSEDGSTMYYTRVKSGKKGVKGVVDLEICVSRKESGGGWKRGESLSINADGSSSFHPHLFNGGKSLLFVSDRSGGKGGMDIYRSDMQSDGSWSSPKNLSWLNSSSDEINPVVLGEEIYFSSTGWSGLGGFDIFRGKLGDSKEKPQNVGYPINSSLDDYGIIFLGRSKGFFATNRYGSDDVLGFDWVGKNP